jgi:hypothetical protein
VSLPFCFYLYKILHVTVCIFVMVVYLFNLTFEVCMVVKMLIVVFWVVMLCSPTEGY